MWPGWSSNNSRLYRKPEGEPELNWLLISCIAVGLAMDAFAVAIAAGLSIPDLTNRHVFRMAWHFGLFQFLMPIMGWAAGSTLLPYIKAYDHWIAFGLLVAVGGKMIHEAFSGDRADSTYDPTRGLMLVVLSVATSIDALAVGLSLAVIQVSIWIPSLLFGLVAAILTTVGARFGGRLGARWRSRAKILGGCVLILIGLRILISHIYG